jgi:hypothetical protein
MTEREVFADRFRHSIEGAVDDPAIDVMPGYGSKFLVSLVTPSFEGMDEGERQAIIWQRVLDGLGPEDRRRIEFIYTDAPSEVEPVETAAPGE